MAKPAKVKKEKAEARAASAGKAGGKAKAKAARAVSKPKKQQAAGGLKGRLSRAPAKPVKGKAAKAAPQGNRVAKFLREVRVELSKVTWPTREELVQSTIVVVIAVAIAGIYIWIFDLLFNWLIGLL